MGAFFFEFPLSETLDGADTFETGKWCGTRLPAQSVPALVHFLPPAYRATWCAERLESNL